ncbi:hypothetical protein ABZ412_34055 [Nocardia sp. NPDC005746]|uniref:hypothetical protein n=1 Tax=Nocardia sp. NPDC005746 TaxID=3157062 RepID=UPI0033E2DC04
MFEFAMQDLRHVRLRIGRWHFRTWSTWAIKLPNGYREPESVYAIEMLDKDDRSLGQLGAFISRETAEACVAQLEAEGRTGVVINRIPVHSRLEDWQFDR